MKNLIKINQNLFFTIITICIIFISLIIVTNVYAAALGEVCSPINLCTVGTICSGGVCANAGAGVTTATICTNCKLDNPLGGVAGVTSVQALIGKVISAVLGVVGSIALIMFIFGGLTWMTASGNAQAVEKGKSILMWATIGLVVIFSSYALVVFVFKDVLEV